MKEKYLEAKVDVILLESTDVIATSAIGNGGLDEDGWV